MREGILSYPELCKIKISFFAALSAGAGFFLASSGSVSGMLILTMGVFILACGSSALNQYQERETDGLMARTKKRPIPSGRIAPLRALCFSLALIIAGILSLLLMGAIPALLLGAFTVVWYNGVYTFLKRKTAFAVIPGALVGAIPPAIGWFAGGGALWDPKLAVTCFVFFMWQVPHFWVLLFNYGREYEEAGLPSLSDLFSRTQLQRITSQWIFAMVVSCFLPVLYGMVHTFTAFLLVAVSAFSAWQGVRLVRSMKDSNSQLVFSKLNYHMLSVVFLVSFDRLTYTLINTI